MGASYKSPAVELHFTVPFVTVGVAAEATVAFGADLAGTLWELIYHGFEDDGTGTGATYQPVCSEVSASSGEDARLSYAAAIAVAVITRDQLDPGIPFKLDGDGNLFYSPNYNAAADNTGTAILRFRAVAGAGIALDAVT